MAETRVHLGCGDHVVPNWVNMDGSWNAWFAKAPAIRKVLVGLKLLPPSSANVQYASTIVIRDLRRPLPFADGTVSAVYASHTLEHLFFEEAVALLQECRRVLKPGGVLRLVVPDLKAIVREYLGEIKLEQHPQMTSDMSKGDVLVYRLNFRHRAPVRGSLFYRMYKNRTDFDLHKWMYDAESLVAHVKRSGFDEVAERQLHDSRISDIVVLEKPSRVANGEGICVEGIKPLSSR